MLNKSVQCQGQSGDQNYSSMPAANLARIFSYHLAWCGDPAKAQWLTERTVSLALRWQSALPSGQAAQVAWWLGLARYTRLNAGDTWNPRLRSGVTENLAPLADQARLAHLSPLFGWQIDM